MSLLVSVAHFRVRSSWMFLLPRPLGEGHLAGRLRPACSAGPNLAEGPGKPCFMSFVMLFVLH
jgi:hypothetical protein